MGAILCSLNVLNVFCLIMQFLGPLLMIYRKVSNIRRTKCQKLNDSHLVLQLSLLNPLRPGVKLRMKM